MTISPIAHNQVDQEVAADEPRAKSGHRPRVSDEKVERLRELMPQIKAGTLSQAKAAALSGMSAASARRYVKKIMREPLQQIQPQQEQPQQEQPQQGPLPQGPQQNEPPESPSTSESSSAPASPRATEPALLAPVASRIAVILPELLLGSPPAVLRVGTPSTPFIPLPRNVLSSPTYLRPMPSPQIDLVEEQFRNEVLQPPVAPALPTRTSSSYETWPHVPGLTPTMDDFIFADGVWADADQGCTVV